jgi:ABC-type amino acid transport substrate-binding protein
MKGFRPVADSCSANNLKIVPATDPSRIPLLLTGKVNAAMSSFSITEKRKNVLRQKSGAPDRTKQQTVMRLKLRCDLPRLG